MSPERQRDTVALVCDEHGLVREVLIDEGRHLINTPRNLPLSAYVDPTSMTKAQNFLQEVEEKGIALDWGSYSPLHRHSSGQADRGGGRPGHQRGDGYV